MLNPTYMPQSAQKPNCSNYCG